MPSFKRAPSLGSMQRAATSSNISHRDFSKMDKTQRHQTIVANLMERFPHKSEEEVRRALGRAKWVPGAAVIALEGGPAPAKPRSIRKPSKEQLLPDAAAPAAEAVSPGGDNAEEEDDEASKEFKWEYRMTPEISAMKLRHERHNVVAKGRSGAMDDLK